MLLRQSLVACHVLRASRRLPQRLALRSVGYSASLREGPKSEAAPKPTRGAAARAWDAVVDVVSVTLGLERKRDIAAEYESGERAYPWVCYPEPGSGRTMYYNSLSGVQTEIQPPDWERFSKPESYVRPDEEAGALRVATPPPSAWSRTVSALGAAPIIASAVKVGEAVAASPVGEAARAVQSRVNDRIEDAREVWETSQHPLIVSASTVVDSVLAESEQGRALRAVQALDSGFDEHAFVDEMQRTYLPRLCAAFFKLDMPVLRAMCKDSALSQVRSVAAARALEGLEHTGPVLLVQRVDIAGARTVEATGDGAGTLPVIVVSSQVQHIHCISNKKGEVVEGGSGDVRVAFFVVAVTREYDPATGQLEWKAVEMIMQSAMVYL